MRVVAFGEIMARLAAPGFLRLRQALPGRLEVTFAGAEANVLSSLALWGAEASFVTALPDNVLADACLATLAGVGVDTRHVVLTRQGRLGLYFLETGANQRSSQIIYDRDGSSISQTGPEQYDWPTIFTGADWFHVTGITPAISSAAADAALAAVTAAKQARRTVSCDLNFRKKLWRWDASAAPSELAQRTMRRILPNVDVVIANESDCQDVLGIRAVGSDVERGRLEIDRYPDVARQLADQFPNVSSVAITLRESVSASHNNWGGMLYEVGDDAVYFAPLNERGDYAPYSITHIVDRVGAGDAFAAGIIFGKGTAELSRPADTIRFAVAASCLAHSIVGDFNFSSRSDIEALMHGASSGRVVR